MNLGNCTIVDSFIFYKLFLFHPKIEIVSFFKSFFDFIQKIEKGEGCAGQGGERELELIFMVTDS